MDKRRVKIPARLVLSSLAIICVSAVVARSGIAQIRELTSATSCPALTPLNPPIASTACANYTGQTCLDATFGNETQLPPGGLTVTNTDGSVPSNNDSDGAVAIKQQQQPDGTMRYLAVGTTTNPSTYSIQGVAMVRYNLDGSLDTAFGSGGIVTYFSPAKTPLGIYDGAIDSAGNILVVGTQNFNSMLLLRFTPTGVLDSTFNSVGYLNLSNFSPYTMRLQTDGKIVVGGIGNDTHGNQIGVVVRVNTNGTLDTTFGVNGQVGIATFYYLEAIALQTVGSQQYILAGGSSGVTTSEKFTVVRLTPMGSVDSSFGASGVATTTFCGAGSRIFSLSVDAHGNILAGGRNYLARVSHPVMAIARFTSNGTLDTTFGDPSGSVRTGQTKLDFYGSNNYVNSIQPVLDAGGNQLAYLVAGSVYQSAGSATNKYLVLTQYHTDGSLDATFGTNGGFTIDFGHHNNGVTSPGNSNLLIQADGRIIITGSANFSTGPYAGWNFALARVWP